jgi:acetyltransferase-like isoleucine patch superfamily enzyme
MGVNETALIEDSTVEDSEVREYATIHDSTIGAGSRIYERTSIKKSTLAGPVDVNANCYVENADIGERVQIGPNATVAGVTHDLSAEGMEFRNDTFEPVAIADGAFVGAGAVVLPGVRIGENAVVGANATVAGDVPAGTLVRDAPERVRQSLQE